MKCLSLLLIIILFVGLSVSAQKEFQGSIVYAHTVVPAHDGYNVQQDYNYIGKTSTFYFRNGDYKWLNDNAYMQMDLFLHKDTVSYLRLDGLDTLITVPNTHANEKILSKKVIPHGDTVLGHVCNVLEIVCSTGVDTWTRRYSYNREVLPMNPAAFHGKAFNSYEVIYDIMKALPLRIQLQFRNRSVTYTATAITPQTLDGNLFSLDPNIPTMPVPQH